MKNRAIISLADSKYFELLNELIDSILSFKESESVSICILDAGLQPDQIKILEKKVHKIVKAKWDIEVPEYKIKGREWLKSQVSRAFLPEYFPGFKKYLWIDADAWVNDWSAVELYFKGSDNQTLSISSSADRAYGRVLRADWIFSNIAFIRSQNYKHAKSSGFSNQISRLFYPDVFVHLVVVVRADGNRGVRILLAERGRNGQHVVRVKRHRHRLTCCHVQTRTSGVSFGQ